MNSVYRATICRVTGMTNRKSRTVRRNCSRRKYASMIVFTASASRWGVTRRRVSGIPVRTPACSRRRVSGLLHRVDRRQDFVRLDFLGEGLFHGSHELEELRAIGERMDADLPFGLQLLEDLVVFSALPLSAPCRAVQPGLENGVLEVLWQLAEGLATEAERPDGDGVLGERDVAGHLVPPHLGPAGGLVLA